MTIVTNPTEFNEAVQAAEPGSTIELTPGVWPRLSGRVRKNEGPPIIIRAAERRKTEISYALLNSWQGFHFEGFRFAGVGKDALFDMGGAQDLTFADCELTSADASWDPWHTGLIGTSIRNAKRIRFFDCDIWRLRQALMIRGSEDVTVEKCRLSHMREGIQVEGSRKVRITRNEFSEWHPNYGRKEHPDMIQFYTRNEPVGNEDVEIADNRFFAGGKRAVQVIFIRSEDQYSGKSPDAWHRDIRILRNLVYTSHKWAIAIQSAKDVLVEGNIVLPSPHAGSDWPRGQDDGRTSAALTPTIHMDEGVTGVAKDNFAPWFSINDEVKQERNTPGWPKLPEEPKADVQQPSSVWHDAGRAS